MNAKRRAELKKAAEGKAPEEMTDDELEAMLDDDEEEGGDKPNPFAKNEDGAEALAKAEQLEEELAKRDEELKKRDERIEALEKRESARERLAKADTLVGDSGIAKADVALVLEHLAKDGAEAFERVIKQATAFSTDAKLFKSLGSSEAPASEDLAKLEAKAVELRKANPKLTKAQSIAASIDEDAYLASLGED